ncbi:hypothetical protein C8Q78DRAFT_1041675 [Trametes maxima]|nr:hypothetical protein C8Q78DRAFT_1041675 [Trametes maxima]
MSEVRRVLQEITPLADRDETAKGQIRELGILIDHVEEGTAKLKMRMREMQRLRLALERFFSQFKDNPRRYNGTWSPQEEEKQGSTDEEEDMAEVEDLTSREILSADLADIAGEPVARMEKGKKRCAEEIVAMSPPPKRLRGLRT